MHSVVASCSNKGFSVTQKEKWASKGAIAGHTTPQTQSQSSSFQHHTHLPQQFHLRKKKNPSH
jgi:hypothetical protein